MKVKTENGYGELLDLLNEHPEFNSFETKECDEVIVALGTKLWEEWEAAESKPEAPTRPNCLADMNFGGNVSQRTKRIVQLLIEGISDELIMKHEHISKANLATYKSRYGFSVSHKTAGGKYGLTKERILELFTVHNTVREAVAEVGCSPECLRHLMKKHGIRAPHGRVRKSVAA